MNDILPHDAAPADLSRVAAELARHRAADVVEYLNRRPVGEAASVLERLPDDQVVAIFDDAALARAADLLCAMTSERTSAILHGMAADRAADVLAEIPEPGRDAFVARLAADTARELNQLIAYPEGSAGSIMTTEFVSVPSTWTVGRTLDHIRHVESSRETVYATYLLDPETGALVQAVSLRRLIVGDPEAPALSIAPDRAPIVVSVLADREDVARLISRYDLLAIPVVDEARRVIGIVTVDDVIDAMIDETTEDVQKFGGMEALDEPYMQIGFARMIRKRAGWLCALFLSEMLTASAMQGFEAELEKAMVLALFVPLIMSSGGNSGSQATSLIIRALALRQVRLRDWWRVAVRELPAGIVLGAFLGLIGIARITLWQKLGLYDYGEHWMLVAATVGATLVGIVTFGSLVGSMLPFALQRVGFDPASASAPFVATLVDVTGLVIYFSVALVILRGTLL